MNRQEVYCEECEAEFTIESNSLMPISFCPNCGSEVKVEYDEAQEWDEEGWV
jgi:rRNA maturation endonuclease Nob1